MLLLLLFLLSCWIIPGTEAEDSPVMYYALTNGSVCLQTRQNSSYTFNEWEFDKKIIVSPIKSNSKYQNKIVFSPENLSLCIKELRDSDAGKYKLSLMDDDFNKIEEIHHVIVQEKVPRPVMTVHASNLSTGSCRITVNCSVQDEWTTSHCNAERCRTSRASESLRKFNISIFTETNAVVCRGNNQVSTSSASENMDVCFSKFNAEHKEESQNNQGVIIIIIVAIVCSFLFVCVVVLIQQLHRHCRKSRVQSIQSQPVETPSQEQPRVSWSSACHAEPCYQNVDQPGHTSSPRQRGGPLESPTAATDYDYPNVSASGNGGEDQEASASRSVAVPEPLKVDTVYCLLQRPGNVT